MPLAFTWNLDLCVQGRMLTLTCWLGYHEPRLRGCYAIDPPVFGVTELARWWSLVRDVDVWTWSRRHMTATWLTWLDSCKPAACISPDDLLDGVNSRRVSG